MENHTLLTYLRIKLIEIGTDDMYSMKSLAGKNIIIINQFAQFGKELINFVQTFLVPYYTLYQPWK